MAALLFLDLDRFKHVNDSFGHTLGDTLLTAVAERLRDTVREGDTVARHGGDEFIILLTDLSAPGDVLRIAAKILNHLSMPLRAGDHEFQLTASIGVSFYPSDGTDLGSLLRTADTAMYRAKEGGGNSLRFYSRDMSAETVDRLRMEGALRRALERQEFELFYQPKVDIGTGAMVGAESLIRWRHPQLGMIPPGRFIPVAEQTGLIVPIGDWVLETACAQMRSWDASGLPRLPVSINLSGRQFRHEGLVKSVFSALRKAHVKPQRLELEITESVAMQDVDQIVAKLNALKDIGVLLSLDDFGTGYSSLGHLKRFPLDKLKVDQSFVRDIVPDADDAAIVRAVINLGHSLDLKVIAEGVETKEQLAFLRSHQCDEMQGYYFSRPVPADDFAALLRADRRLGQA
jgi:diguanylate cyclase (GGDEF)-like protein